MPVQQLLVFLLIILQSGQNACHNFYRLGEKISQKKEKKPTYRMFFSALFSLSI